LRILHSTLCSIVL